MFNFFYQIKSLLKENSKLLLSHPIKYAGLSNDRDSNHRLMIIHSKEYFKLHLSRLGFNLINQFQRINKDAMNREVEWNTLGFTFFLKKK